LIPTGGEWPKKYFSLYVSREGKEVLKHFSLGGFKGSSSPLGDKIEACTTVSSEECSGYLVF
jgi:hypothetical protein